MDSDDVLCKDAVRLTCKALESDKHISMVFTNHKRYDKNLKKVIRERNKKVFFDLHCRYKGTLEDPLLHMSFPGPFSVFRRIALKDVGGYRNLPNAQDYDLILRVAYSKKEVNIKHISRFLYKYRKNPSSIRIKRSRAEITKRTAAYLLRNLRELGFPVSDVKYRGRIQPSNSTYYDIYSGGILIEVPWIEKMAFEQ